MRNVRKFGRICFWPLMMCLLIVVNVPADITKGLIGHWPLDGNGKDVSGNGYHGELTKGTKESKGQVNGAIAFDGKGSHIKVAHGKFKPTLVDFTVAVWIKAEKVQFPWTGLIAARGNAAQAFWMGFRNSTDTLTYVWNNNNGQTWNWPKSVTIPKQTWALVAVAIEKGRATTYAYTASTKKLDVAINKIKHLKQSPQKFVFGKDDCCGQRFYKGLLDEVMMFERALAKSEILQLASSGLTNVTTRNKLTTSWGKIKRIHTSD